MTQRVVCVWFRHWHTDLLERREQHQGLPGPRAVYEATPGGDRIIALNRTAEQRRLQAGLLMTDAKAILPSLEAIPSDPFYQEQELEKLARWCVRFSPWVSTDLPDGMFLDATGITHLYGGEKAFLKTLYSTFTRLRFNVRLAIADTAGAAWGFAHYGHKPVICVPAGQHKQLAANLPTQALRITSAQTEQLASFGLKFIGQLYQISPVNFRPRFGKLLLKRLEQLVHPGREALSPLIHEPEYFASLNLPEPVGRVDDIRFGVDMLLKKITRQLASHGKGARCFSLSLYGISGGYYSIAVKTCEPCNEIPHITHLFKERLTALENRFDPGFEIDAFSLHAQQISTKDNKQAILSGGKDIEANINLLLDRLTARLGRNAVKQYSFRESHIPERAVISVSPGGMPVKNIPVAENRPILLLPEPEAIRAIAEVPDYPPRQFEWRYRTYRIVRAEGPERVANEWWRNQKDRKLTRDYFRVEDRTGARFWLFRKGIYQRETGAPEWFIHGVFA